MIFLTQIYYIKHAGCSISLCSQDTKRTLEVGKSPGWNNGLQLVSSAHGKQIFLRAKQATAGHQPNGSYTRTAGRTSLKILQSYHKGAALPPNCMAKQAGRKWPRLS
jgi:hypothetical protein